MNKLTGDKLLAKLKEIEEYDYMKLDQATICGYTNYSEFVEAIFMAKGLITSIKICPTCGHKKRFDSMGLPF